jgi:putative ABC transport system substrate-binding protein
MDQAHDFGWVEGSNLRVEHRWTSGNAQEVAAFTKELVELRPDVIVVNSTPLLTALMRETSVIPIVFVRVADPVGQGLIASLARPGGNATGFTNFEFSMGGKWLELLKEIAPDIARVVVLFNPRTVPYEIFLRSIETTAPTLALEVRPAPAQNAEDIEHIISGIAQGSRTGLIILPDIFTIENRTQIIRLAHQTGLPTVYPYDFFATEGGLLSYGIDAVDVYRQAATYVDRILRGTKPGDLPVQAPDKFTLVVNLKTAKALGLTVPMTLQAAADEVID